jgi:hypothetical protein
MGLTMDRLRWYGSMITASAVIGLLASELIGTAHAHRDGRSAYAVAVSSGPELLLRKRRSGSLTSPPAPIEQAQGRILICRSVVGIAGVSIGYGCRSA